MDNKLIVSKEKCFVQAMYRITLDEQRLLHYAITKVHPFKFKNRLIYHIDIVSIAKFFDIDLKVAYKQFNDALEHLFTRQISFIEPELKKTIIKARIINEHHQQGSGVIGFTFTEVFKSLICDNKEFLSYSLEKTIGMTSATAVRIYEILLLDLKQSQLKTINRPFKIEDFKKILGLEDKYPRFSNFKVKILEVAQKQINKHTDLNISYEIKKIGRSPTSIAFKVKYKVKRKVIKQGQAKINNVSKDKPTIKKATVEPERPLTLEQRKQKLAELKKIR